MISTFYLKVHAQHKVKNTRGVFQFPKFWGLVFWQTYKQIKVNNYCKFKFSCLHLWASFIHEELMIFNHESFRITPFKNIYRWFNNDLMSAHLIWNVYVMMSNNYGLGHNYFHSTVFANICMVAYICPLCVNYFSIKNVNMTDNFFDMQENYVNMEHIYVYMQENCNHIKII